MCVIKDILYLYTNVRCSEPLEQDYSCDRMHFLLGRYEKGASLFYEEYAANNKFFSDEPVKRMSALTHNLLCGIDYEDAIDRRTRNFEYLHRCFSNENKLKLKVPKGGFMYPLYIEHASSTDEDIYNILLIGSDRRDDSWNGNSDVMMLITVNDSTQKIVMTSFMRDLYADIPGYGVHKLNYAYAAGGASLLVATLEDNYDVEIDNYAAVDFDGMAQIIDLIGGVDMELSDAEVEVMNSYLESMGQADQCLSVGGYYHLSGYQAVAHMRDRYVGNYDYERTERQRDVLTEIFMGLQGKDAAELTDLAQQALDLTDNDITPIELLSLLPSLPSVINYTLVENRIPYDGLYSSQDEMLVPDFPATVERLHEFMYE